MLRNQRAYQFIYDWTKNRCAAAVGAWGGRMVGRAAVGAAQGFGDVAGSRQHGDHHVGLVGDRATGVGPECAPGNQFRRGLAAKVVDHQRESGLLQIAGHARAHAPEADESDGGECLGGCRHRGCPRCRFR